MEFEWDEHNQSKNKMKHNVDYFEAEEIFANTPLQILKDMKHSGHEERHMAFGQTDNGRYLMVVFTKREHKLRIISARDQSRKERVFYTSSVSSL